MIINGRQIADEMLSALTESISQLPVPPSVAAVLFTNDEHEVHTSRTFLRLKGEAARKLGIVFELYELDAGLTTRQARAKLLEISKKKNHTAIVVQLPLPQKITTQYVLNAIPPEKDPDVLSQKSQGAFFVERSDILPPAVVAVDEIFKRNAVDVRGKSCVVFGYGLLVGKPISHWLASHGATVTIVNEFTEKPARFSREADIIVSGVGQPDLITSDMVREGVVVIDFGATHVDGSVRGDVAPDVADKASLMTPVPGGLGPIVIAALLKNVVNLVQKRNRI